MKFPEKLPNSWVLATCGEIADIVGGGTPATTNPNNFGGSISWITPADLSKNTGKFIGCGARFLSKQGMESSGARLLPKKTVLFSSRAPIGYVAIAAQPLTTNQGFKSFVPATGILSEYLYYWLIYATPLAEELASGTTFLEISGAKAALIPLPIAPLAEQIRIVEKLEELFSDLDAGVAELKAAQKKLAQYRQSLLKVAVTGELTAEWRRKNTCTSDLSPTETTTLTHRPPLYERGDRGDLAPNETPLNPPFIKGDLKTSETGAQLLERILQERRARWEEKQLARFKEQGKTPHKGWQDKYPEPVQPDTANLQELPEGWVWASVDQLSVFITSGSRGWADYYSQSGAVFIRSQDINTDALVLGSAAHVKPPATSEGVRTKVQMHDLLITITGANVAKCAVVDVDLEEAYVSQHVALVRPVFEKLAGYLHMYLISGTAGRKQLLDFAYGAGKPGLNLHQVASVVVPLPPENEMDHIVEVVTTAFNELLATQETLFISLKQSAAQRKNILKSAFSGQLVPQDPNDERASVLLERIRSERAEMTKKTNRARTRGEK